MDVTLKYTDSASLTVEEVVKLAHYTYGKNVQVSVMPDSTQPYDLIYFGLSQLITHEQISLLFDKGGAYQQDLKKLRHNVLLKVEEIIDQVIIDNESKVG